MQKKRNITSLADFTKIIYESRNKEPGECKSTELTVMDNAFREVKNYSLNIHENPTFIEHIVLTSILEKELLNYKVDKDSIMYAKKNLKRRIERDMPGIRFINYGSLKVLVYPDTLQLVNVIKEHYETKLELEALNASSKDEQAIVKAAELIRHDIKTMKDEMPWPPNPGVLELDKICLPHTLDLLLNFLLSGNYKESSSTRVNTLKLSLGMYHLFTYIIYCVLKI